MSQDLNPKEKAKDLIKRFTPSTMDFTERRGFEVNLNEAKDAATYCVNEFIEEHNFKAPIGWNVKRKAYWEAVKLEILNYKTD